MVIVTRADLNLSKGKMAAQCGHAVSECVLKASSNDAKLLKRYLSDGARKIVVAAPHLEALKRIYGEAAESGIICSIIKDSGHTEIPPGTITVVGIGPGIRSDIDSITSRLPLVK